MTKTKTKTKTPVAEQCIGNCKSALILAGNLIAFLAAHDEMPLPLLPVLYQAENGDVDPVQGEQAMQALVGAGHVERRGFVLAVTPSGRALADAWTAERERNGDDADPYAVDGLAALLPMPVAKTMAAQAVTTLGDRDDDGDSL